MLDDKSVTLAIVRGYTAPVTVGDNIRKIRERLGLQQVDLADRLKIRQPSAWTLENQDGLPEAGTLLKLAKALSCSVEELLEGVDPDYDAVRRDLIRHDHKENQEHTQRAGDPHHAGYGVDQRSDRDNYHELRASLEAVSIQLNSTLTDLSAILSNHHLPTRRSAFDENTG